MIQRSVRLIWSAEIVKCEGIRCNNWVKLTKYASCTSSQQFFQRLPRSYRLEVVDNRNFISGIFLTGSTMKLYALYSHTARSFNQWQRVVSELYYNVYFTRLRCINTPCLSTWLHSHFSYGMKILKVVSIVFCYQKYIICDKVQALSWTNRYPAAWTVRNLWRILA